MGRRRGRSDSTSTAQKGITKKCQRCHVRPANIHQVEVSHLKSNTSAFGVQFAMRGKKNEKALDSQTFRGKSRKRAGHAADLASSHVGKATIDTIRRASLMLNFFFSTSETTKRC